MGQGFLCAIPSQAKVSVCVCVCFLACLEDDPLSLSPGEWREMRIPLDDLYLSIISTNGDPAHTASELSPKP